MTSTGDVEWLPTCRPRQRPAQKNWTAPYLQSIQSSAQELKQAHVKSHKSKSKMACMIDRVEKSIDWHGLRGPAAKTSMFIRGKTEKLRVRHGAEAYIVRVQTMHLINNHSRQLVLPPLHSAAHELCPRCVCRIHYSTSPVTIWCYIDERGA